MPSPPRPDHGPRPPTPGWTAAALGTVLAVPLAAATPDPRWAGDWRELPARTHLFFPATLRLVRRPPATLLLATAGEVLRFRCSGQTSGRAVACRRPTPGQLLLQRREPGPPTATRRWRLAADRLTATTRIRAPDGRMLVDEDRYRRVGGPGLAGIWRNVASRETPTHYRFAFGPGWLWVQADGGLLDFHAPLVGRVPTARDRQGADHIYGAVAPDRLVELSFHAGRLVGRSDLALARNGRSFTERHVDAAGHRMVIVFARLGTAPGSAAPAD